MAVGSDSRLSKVEIDGRVSLIPGLAQLNADQPAFLIQTGLTSIFGGASGNLINWLAPCAYKAVGAFAICTVVPGTGAATIGAGTTADTDGLLDDETMATNETAAFQDLTSSASFTGAALFGTGALGDIVVFQTDGGGTTTGKAIWGLVIVPN